MGNSSKNVALVYRLGWLVWLTIAGSLVVFCQNPIETSDLGVTIYKGGVNEYGKPIKATTQGDLGVVGTQLSCASCHRPSGYGSSEGGNYVPPITGPALFNKRELDRADLFKKMFKESQPRRFSSRVRSPRVRTAYTKETLSRAIRDGIDASGRSLDRLMPRYTMSDREMDALVNYLQSLSTTNDPGVNEEKIVFATITSDRVDAQKKKAMLATMREFFQWMNIDTRGDLKNPQFSPNYRSEFLKAYRLWELEIWELKGDPKTWPEQLEVYYGKQPVFAIIGGMTDGPWASVQAFCEQKKLLNLFPVTDLPGSQAESEFVVYFHRGLSLEARVMALFINQMAPAAAPPILMYSSKDPFGQVPAEIFASAYPGEVVPWREGDGWPSISGGDQVLVDNVILWPDRMGTALAKRLGQIPPHVKRIFLPSRALELLPESIVAAYDERLHFTYPYEKPGAYHPRAFRVRAWMRTRQLNLDFPRLQFNTYYALTTVQFGLESLVDHFSRAYLLEYVEHEAENALNPGTFPRLGLGPGQRFASKGGFVVKVDSSQKNLVVPVSKWLIPEFD